MSGWTTPLPNRYFEGLAFSAQEKRVRACLAEFPEPKPDECRPHLHEGTEFIFVTRGVLTIHCHGEDNVTGEGDSVYFDSSEPHSYRSGDDAQAIMITIPPRA